MGMTLEEAIAYQLALRFTRAMELDQYDFTPQQALFYWVATEEPFKETVT